MTVRLPSQPFGELAHPPEPDYARPEFWAAHPSRSDAANLVPDRDLIGDRQRDALVDVFYVHPTTYRGADYRNQPLNGDAVNRWTDESVIARQAAIFNGCCRVFAPRYRQASAAASSEAFRCAGGYASSLCQPIEFFFGKAGRDGTGQPGFAAGEPRGRAPAADECS